MDFLDAGTAVVMTGPTIRLGRALKLEVAS